MEERLEHKNANDTEEKIVSGGQQAAARETTTTGRTPFP
jgi:hypothetical protein